MILNHLTCVPLILAIISPHPTSPTPAFTSSHSTTNQIVTHPLNNYDITSNKLELGSFQRCIKGCVCDVDHLKRKRVICESAGLTKINTNSIDSETRVLIIDGKPDQENNLNLGKIFNPLKSLEEIKISYSRLPAIGESTFYPETDLKSLDLSHNLISLISPLDFFNLSRLVELDLSDNQLDETTIPSVPFKYLISLERLSLARNKFNSIVPREFYPLSQLTHLDLSGNPLSEVKPDNFIDVPLLTHLLLEGCGLKDIPTTVYKKLNNLNTLNLKGNRLTFLTSYGFKHLTNLRHLYLDGNQLSVLNDHTFDGLQLNHLGLSANQLTGLSQCTFCSSTIESLDLSSNQLLGIVDNLLEPIAHSLSTLNVNNNPSMYNPSVSIINLIRPLRKIQALSLGQTSLDDSLLETTFTNSTSLLNLNLSGNKFVNLQPELFRPLQHLEVLNLSHNSLSSLDPSVLETLDSITTLRLIDLDNNPWSCSRCHILPMISWINQMPAAYFNLCSRDGPNAGKFCAKCVSPSHLEGRPIHAITDSDIEFCHYTKIQMRLTYPQPKIGMVLGTLVLLSITFLIIIIGLIYRRQGATYYTNEKEPRLALPEESIDEAFIIECTDGSSLKQSINPKDLIHYERPGSPVNEYKEVIGNNQHYITTINSPSNLSPYSTYTSFEPRLRY